eukprot:5328164-Karenia_brevis.AAC.1
MDTGEAEEEAAEVLATGAMQPASDQKPGKTTQEHRVRPASLPHATSADMLHLSIGDLLKVIDDKLDALGEADDND